MKLRKDLRLNHNLSQDEVGEKLEVCQSAVARWENGTANPLPKYQRKLAALYGCTIEELFEVPGG